MLFYSHTYRKKKTPNIINNYTIGNVTNKEALNYLCDTISNAISTYTCEHAYSPIECSDAVINSITEAISSFSSAKLKVINLFFNYILYFCNAARCIF